MRAWPYPVHVLGRTHVLIAAASWLAVYLKPTGFGLDAPLAGIPDAPLLGAGLSLGAVAFGALLPDLDHPHATISQIRILGVRAFAPIAYAAHTEFRHRGRMHSLLAAVLIYLAGSWLAGQVGLSAVGAALTWGYTAHILADFFTDQGVPLLWPLSRARLSAPGPLAVRTGGYGELLYLMLVAVVSTLYVTGTLTVHP